MFTRKLFSLVAVLIGMATSFGAYAQNVNVSGTVTDNMGSGAKVCVSINK